MDPLQHSADLPGASGMCLPEIGYRVDADVLNRACANAASVTHSLTGPRPHPSSTPCLPPNRRCYHARTGPHGEAVGAALVPDTLLLADRGCARGRVTILRQHGVCPSKLTS
jgi:hypothetical protein